MPYFLLGLSVLIGGYLIFRGLRLRGPINISKFVPVVIMGAVVLVFAATAISGRLGAFGWLLLLLPAILQWGRIRQGLRNMRGPTPGRTSDIETRYLRMKLEHDSGVLSGTVLEGAHRGRRLDELTLPELLDLLRECRVEDPRSSEVLETYLDRVHGTGWRQGDESGERGADRGRAASSAGPMTPEDAYEILGLKPGATDQEIRDAHRRLLKANHPDRGGSTWLAAQINLAKDLLLPHG